MELSKSGCALVSKMLEESMYLKYGYRETIEGCFDYCIQRYGMEIPPEPKEVIVTRVIQILED